MVSYSISWLCAKVPKPNKTAKIMLKILFFIMVDIRFTHFTECNRPPIYLCSTLQTANLRKSKHLRATFFSFLRFLPPCNPAINICLSTTIHACRELVFLFKFLAKITRRFGEINRRFVRPKWRFIFVKRRLIFSICYYAFCKLHKKGAKPESFAP